MSTYSTNTYKLSLYFLFFSIYVVNACCQTILPCNSKLTVFLQLRSRKTVRFSEQIMSADKYLSIFSRQMEVSVSFSLKIICAHYVSLSPKIIWASCFVIAENYMHVLCFGISEIYMHALSFVMAVNYMHALFRYCLKYMRTLKIICACYVWKLYANAMFCYC